MTTPRTDPPTPDPRSRLGRVLDDYRDKPTWTARDAILTAVAADDADRAALPSAPDQRPDDVQAFGAGQYELGREAGIREGILRERALSEATTSPEATLDVEPLARALLQTIRNFLSDTYAAWGDDEALGDLRAYAAPFLAAEYARLRGPA